MPLAIDTLDIHCRAAPERRQLASDLEQWVRNSFADALGPHLGPSLDTLGGIHIIRRIDVRLRLTARDWTEGRFLRAVCRAFSEALFRTLTQPPSADSDQRVHYEDEVAWRAALIHWLLHQDRQQAWHFEVAEELQPLNARSASLLLMLEDPGTLTTLLRLLGRSGTLTHLASVWDDLELERIFLAMSGGPPEDSPSLTLHEVLRLLRFALKVGPPTGRGFASRQHALLMFAASPPVFASVRTIFHLLQAARSILEYPLLAFPRSEESSSGASIQSAVSAWRTILEGASGTAEWEALRSELTDQLPAAPRESGQAELGWIRSSNAGVFLLAPMALILNWHSKSGVPPRVFSWVMAGVFQSVIGRFDVDEPVLDQGASLAAGLGLEPSLRDVRALLAGVDLGALVHSWQIDPSGDISTFLIRAGGRLLAELGGRIRGFRHAPPEVIARAFIRIPGRIQVAGERLRVVLDPLPYAVALHISGCDGEQPRLPWLDPWTVSLVLEGL